MATTTEAERAAVAYMRGGLSVLPIRADGSKAPALPSWAEYQRRLPTLEELAAWFGSGPRGVAILGGPVSQGLEVVDIDDAHAWQQYGVVVRTLLDAEGEALPVLPIVRTPSGGAHVYYRHDGEQHGNTKLAQDATGHTLIETRGKGGYVLAPGCPPACHPSGRTYDLVRGDLGAVPTVTDTQRAILLDAARSLSRVSAPADVVAPRPRETDGTRPGDVYTQRASWDGLLRRHGWRRIGQHGDTGLWRRPGKERGSISATTNHGGCGLLYVFSSNAAPLEAGRAYNLFGAYGLLDHGGDYRAAAEALKALGYTAPPAVVVDMRRARGTAPTLDGLLQRRLQRTYAR
jgi:putative DNA primase/helicase